jgi:hypothetical protein
MPYELRKTLTELIIVALWLRTMGELSKTQ